MQRNQEINTGNLNTRKWARDDADQVDYINQKHHAILQLSAPLSFFKFAF